MNRRSAWCVGNMCELRVMEIFPTKALQFKPVMLHLPGHKRDYKEPAGDGSKSLSKENPELWKTYKRLSVTQLPEIALDRRSNREFVPPTVTYPSIEGIQCMCCENVMKIVRDRACIPHSHAYRLPSGNEHNATFESIRPTWARKAMHYFRKNEQLQLPITTILVRWQLKRKLPNYDPETLKSLFDPFGEIEDIHKLSPNSCLVVFKNISAACRVIQLRCIGNPMNKLHCSWWHNSMTNKIVVARGKRISVKTNHYIV